jgi:hypothetical protein
MSIKEKAPEPLTGPNKSQNNSHSIHIKSYVIKGFTLDRLHCEISWLRGLFSQLDFDATDDPLHGSQQGERKRKPPTSCSVTQTKEKQKI